jgi:hypothetical protein
MGRKISAAFGAALGVLGATGADSRTCGYRAWDPNTQEEEYVPYYRCVGDAHKERPPHPPKPPHPDKPPQNTGCGGGGYHHHGHHHNQGTPTPQPNPNKKEEPPPDYLKKFNEGLHGPETDKEKLFRKFDEELKKQKHPEVE